MTKKIFYIAVDCQYDFVMSDGKLPVQGAESTIAPIIKYIANLEPETTRGILFTLDTHVPKVYTGSPESEQFPIHCVKGTHGWNLVANPSVIDDRIPVYTLEKGVFNMWEESNVMIESYYGDEITQDREAFFEALKAEDVDHVVVFGHALNFCVKWTVDGLVERNFSVSLVQDLCKGIDTGRPQDTDAKLLFATTKYPDVEVI